MRLLDIIVFYGLPALIGATIYLSQLNLSWPSRIPGFQRIAAFQMSGLEGILGGVSIYTALLFGLLVQLFQLKARFLDGPDERTHIVDLTDELEINLSYAILVGICTTAILIFVVATTKKDTPAGKLASALIATFIVHLILTLFMALKRARAVYKGL